MPFQIDLLKGDLTSTPGKKKEQQAHGEQSQILSGSIWHGPAVRHQFDRTPATVGDFYPTSRLFLFIFEVTAPMGTNTSKSLFDQALKEIMAGNYVAAELLLQQASEINEEGTTLYAASWAVLLALRNRGEEAIQILEEKLEGHSTDSSLLLAYGLTLEKQERFDDAEDAFRESLESDPESPGALRGLSVCLERKGDVVGGCRLAAKAFSLAPDNLVLAKTAAELLEKAGQTNTAFEVMELGAHYNPEDEELVTGAVKGCLSRGEDDRAWDILVQVDEKSSWAAGWKASFLDWRGDQDRANDLIQTTLQNAGGEDIDFLFQLCCILMRRGEIAAAESYIEHILRMDPQHAGALRMLADFSIGNFEYNATIDPLASAIEASTALPGWARFWHLVNSGELEDAEETLAEMAEDESLNSEPAEVARLELAEQFFLVLSTSEMAESELHSLDELPVEASCGILLEFLEVLDGRFSESEELREFRTLLNEELGRRDPVLRLTRLYALGRWDELAEALDEFEVEVADPSEEEATDRLRIGRLYSLLHALGTGDEEAVTNFNFQRDPDFTGMVFDVLFQKREKNKTEQRFLDKLQGEVDAITVNDLPLPKEGDDYEVGGLLNSRDAEVVIYETEDGELIENFNEDDYEVVEEVEPDPEDEDYEYVWVEEEVEVEQPGQDPAPTDSY
jgi:tetratricopeptide (TPR) repeat protein